MVTPECCEQGQDGEHHGHQDDELKADAKVLEVVCLNKSFQSKEDNTLNNQLSICFTHHLNDLDV